jgi:hypothetical protein
MSERPENEFPTIADLRDGLTRLVDNGLGDLPVQVLVVPDSTMQAIARQAGSDGVKPALMIELNYDEGTGRIPVTVVSTDRMQGRGMASSGTQ